MTWPIVFGAALIADIVTTKVAFSRGKVEGNPIIRRFSNPVLVMLILSALIVFPAEICRAMGLRGVEWIYLAGAIPHAIASSVNAIFLLRR